MLGPIPEFDRKVFRKLREMALERFCERTLAVVASVDARQDVSFHERYLETYGILKKRERELASAFDRFSRSSALF